MLKKSRRNWPVLFHFRRKHHNPPQWHLNFFPSHKIHGSSLQPRHHDIWFCFKNVHPSKIYITPEKRTNDNGKFQPWRCISKTKMDKFPACHLSFWGLYCWWLKSCTTWNAWNPKTNGINYLSTGAGFLPSTVSPFHLFCWWPFISASKNFLRSLTGVRAGSDRELSPRQVLSRAEIGKGFLTREPPGLPMALWSQKNTISSTLPKKLT